MGLNILRSRGIFFSLDALLALALVLLLILTVVPILQSTQVSNEVASDVISVLSTLKVGEFDNNLTKTWISQGLINNTNNTLLEQLGEFYATNLSRARVFADLALSGLAGQKNVGIWFVSTDGSDKSFLASKNTTPYETAENLEVARQLLSGVSDVGGSGNLTGYSARATLVSSLQTKYYYFGGYVGDGNISLQAEYAGNISSAELELAVNNNFSAYVRGNYIGAFNRSADDFTPVRYTINTSFFQSGNNTFELRANTPIRVMGGYLKISYISEVQYRQPRRQYLPGIKGIINLYDGVHLGGTLTNFSIFLHYKSNLTMLMTVGNITVYNSTQGEGSENRTLLTNAKLSPMLNYMDMSNKTVPFRIGLAEVVMNGSGGNADVVLITDLSGSMDYRMDGSSTSGTERNCTNSQLYTSGTTKRISVAKCIDIDFLTTILSVGGNRVGLVSFNESANDYVNLTNDRSLLNATVMDYNTDGYTCIPCALNRANWILHSQSNSSSRKQFVIMMTDGQTNRRSFTDNSLCNGYSLNDIDGEDETSSYICGVSGIIMHREGSGLWRLQDTPTTRNLNGISMHNSTFGFAVGDLGTIIKWNGINWSTISSGVADNLRGIDFLNSNLAYAVGENGRILGWDGNSWSSKYTNNSIPYFEGVDAYNSNFAFAVGTVKQGSSYYGVVYKTLDGGTTWTQDYKIPNTQTNLTDVKFVNSTLAFAVGIGNTSYSVLVLPLYYTGFEAGASGWLDPGANTDRYNGNSNCNDAGGCGSAGSWSWHIQDDTSTSYTSQNFDFSKYDYVNISFYSMEDGTNSWENNEYVSLLCDDTEIWRQDYNDCTGGTYCNYSVLIRSSDCVFDSSVEIRFTGNPGLSDANDDWYIDGIKIVNITGLDGQWQNIIQWNGTSWGAINYFPSIQDLFALDVNGTETLAAGGDFGISRVLKKPDLDSGWGSELNLGVGSLFGIRDYGQTIYATGASTTILENSLGAWSQNLNVGVMKMWNFTKSSNCDSPGCNDPDSFTSENAVFASCRIREEHNATVHSVGFAIESCIAANRTMNRIAQCGNGTYFASTNATALKEFYDSIANDILKVSYSEQTSSTIGNISGILYPDSYVEFGIDEPPAPYGLYASMEQMFSNLTGGNFSIPDGTQVLEAKVISYSGPRWTVIVDANGRTVYDLRKYGNSFVPLGDPYPILLPLSLLVANNNVSMLTGTGPASLNVSSLSNKIIYLLLANASTYTTNLVSQVQGCIWKVMFEDGTSTAIPIPSSYNGTDQCCYGLDTCPYQIGGENVSYYYYDAYQQAAFQLLEKIDFDKDRRVDVKFDDQNLQISATSISGIPFGFATEVQVRTWY